MDTTDSQLDDFVLAVSHCLQPLADAERALPMAAYMRGQFEFLGIPTPLRRTSVLPLLKPPRSARFLLAASCALWQLPEREFQYVAVDLLARQHQVLALADLDAVLGLAQQRAWWDTVDSLAGVVGDIVHRQSLLEPEAQQPMDAAVTHPNVWVRRIAMLHQLGWRADTDEARLFGYASQLAREPDFFIRKAIGWALRDYAKHAPDAVRAYLAREGLRLSPLSVREATKHLVRS